MAISKVATSGNKSSATGATSVSPSITATAGNLLVAVVGLSTSGSGTNDSISTPAGWSGGLSIANGAPNGAGWVGYLPNNAGGSLSWTWNFTLGTGNTSQAWAWSIMEFSGAATSGPLDLAMVHNNTGATASSTVDTTAASGTTKSGDLLIGGFILNRSTPPTLTVSGSAVPATGWTVDTQQTSTGGAPNCAAVFVWNILSGTSTNPDCLCTGSTVTSYEAFLQTFQVPTAAVAVTWPIAVVRSAWSG